MKELIIKSSDNKKEVVTYNEWGQPTGDEEWEEARKVQQGRATQNKYPHHMSRLGYAGLEAKIEKDEGQCGIDRSELWSRGHVPKKGGHTEEIKEDYNQQFQEGNVEIDGSNDILTMALGTPEYSGRVQGMGFHNRPCKLAVGSRDNIVVLGHFRFVDDAPASIRLLLNTIQGVDESVVVNVPLDEEVFREAFHFPVFKEDIIEFCTLQKIGAVPITLYMRHLHHLVTQYGYQARYMFMVPSAVATEGGSREDRAISLTNTLQIPLGNMYHGAYKASRKILSTKVPWRRRERHLPRRLLSALVDKIFLDAAVEDAFHGAY
ncbi:hypothetical protein PanWU01x14_332140 [Parasponia andersonii]|uniref:Uncharacterized protein n=1 Tax=Parasponia andersonii TaxID=3476 RepID=A0A2P5AHF1_PARAD|nr:hypothetical protein PanWU01x14_332140 [Parasponia andersonii]